MFFTSSNNFSPLSRFKLPSKLHWNPNQSSPLHQSSPSFRKLCTILQIFLTSSLLWNFWSLLKLLPSITAIFPWLCSSNVQNSSIRDYWIFFCRQKLPECLQNFKGHSLQYFLITQKTSLFLLNLRRKLVFYKPRFSRTSLKSTNSRPYLLFPFLSGASSVSRDISTVNSIRMITRKRTVVSAQVMVQLIMVLCCTTAWLNCVINRFFPSLWLLTGTPMFVNEVLHGTACIIL